MGSKETMIKTKDELKEWLRYERSIYGNKGNFFGSCGYFRELFPVREMDILRKHQVLLRKCEFYINSKHKVLADFYSLRLTAFQNKYSIHIPCNTCEKGLRLMHVGPILINRRARIGKDCTFHINTAVVAGGTNDDVPFIHDKVIVGYGAVVLGGIIVEENVAIGANAVVNKDIKEKGITVAGVPAKKVSNNGASNLGKR